MLAAYIITIHVPAVSIMISALMVIERWVRGRLLLVFGGGLRPRMILFINLGIIGMTVGVLGTVMWEAEMLMRPRWLRRNFPGMSRIRLKPKKGLYSLALYSVGAGGRGPRSG